MDGEKPDPDDFDLDEDLDEEAAPPEERSGFASKMLGDLARRALMTGIGAVFMSEETLRGQLSDMKLPKEAMQYVVSTADKTKREIVAAIARETRDFLGKLEVDKVLGRALVGTTIEIQTRIRVLPKGEGGPAVAVEQSDTRLVSADDEGKPRSKRKRGKRDDGE